MAISGILASGEVTTSQNDIFAVSQLAVSAKIEKVVFFSKTSDSRTVILFVKPKFDPARSLRQFILEEDESGEYLEPGEFLEISSGDSLQASASGSSIDFVVFGEIEFP